jgi:hypothetical protein
MFNQFETLPAAKHAVPGVWQVGGSKGRKVARLAENFRSELENVVSPYFLGGAAAVNCGCKTCTQRICSKM